MIQNTINNNNIWLIVAINRYIHAAHMAAWLMVSWGSIVKWEKWLNTCLYVYVSECLFVCKDSHCGLCSDWLSPLSVSAYLDLKFTNIIYQFSQVIHFFCFNYAFNKDTVTLFNCGFINSFVSICSSIQS